MSTGFMVLQWRLRRPHFSPSDVSETNSAEDMSRVKGVKQKTASIDEGKELQTDARIDGTKIQSG